MGIASNAWWAAKRYQIAAISKDGAVLNSDMNSRVTPPFLIPSPNEEWIPQQQKFLMAKHYSQEGVKAGTKAAAIACLASAIPTLIGARVIPWGRVHLNYNAQALIISTVMGAAYFIVADQTVLHSARKNSFGRRENVERPFKSS